MEHQYIPPTPPIGGSTTLPPTDTSLPTPTSAYNLLDTQERRAVDDYINITVQTQRSNRQRIALALHHPIPSEYVRRSKGALARPLVRAAVAERLQTLANEEDLSPDRVIKEHSYIAFSNIADYITVMPMGDFACKSLDQIPREALQAVKSLKTIPSPYGIRTEVVLHDKHPSLKVLTELMGLVAPDRPPTLQEYIRATAPHATQQATHTQGTSASEAEYIAMLEG